MDSSFMPESFITMPPGLDRVTPRLLNLLLAVGLTGLAVAAVFLWEGEVDGTQLGVIPTITAIVVAKRRGKKEGSATEVLADNPAAAFVFSSLIDGNTDDAEELLAEDVAAYANDVAIVDPDAGDSIAQFRANVAFWRDRISNVSVEVYDELREKDKHKTEHVALRCVIAGSINGQQPKPFEFGAAAFITVVDSKATEWRMVFDTEFPEELRGAALSELSEQGI